MVPYHQGVVRCLKKVVANLKWFSRSYHNQMKSCHRPSSGIKVVTRKSIGQRQLTICFDRFIDIAKLGRLPSEAIITLQSGASTRSCHINGTSCPATIRPWPCHQQLNYEVHTLVVALKQTLLFFTSPTLRSFFRVPFAFPALPCYPF